ncbi:aminotransferase class I/II-fold pyridoxal phosphate-dependent enzyme [Paraburkholderia sp. C35]|uniref:threonine aldolase family protein n=1 Tax=Paraburkholderia sp. C35 TaxID=2126993 RepID=UPI000D68A5A3|nr:aminotransferase class I/II-fold pyridoxal phosphate-dependent enzyme [Paraburkholderia sp. C35]
MTTFSFLDDYSEGAHPDILRALSDSNFIQQAAYGDDAYSTEATTRIKAHLGSDFGGEIHYVASGTMANIVSISSCLRPHEAVIAVNSGHIVVREAGAIEATGHKLICVPAVDGKLTTDNIEAALSANAHFPHMAKPRLVYVSNATETGTIYSREELTAISALARQRNLLLFVDGARLGAALASTKNDLTLSDIASLADIFWIGGTKAGALLGEAIVICHPALARDFGFHVKQRGGMLAKGRLLGIQFQTLFGHSNLFFENADYANRMAARLAEGILDSGHLLDSEPATNQVFAILPDSVIQQLKQHFDFYVWAKRDDDRSVIRLVTSWATDVKQVDAFLSRLVQL